MTEDEQRKYPRINTKQVSQLRKIDPPTGSSEASGMVHNMSRGGVFIETSMLFEVGDWVEFNMEFDLFHKNRKVTVVGVVRWRSQDVPKGVGIEFSRMTTRDKRKLHTVIMRRARKKSKGPDDL